MLSFKVVDRIFIRGQAENIHVDDSSVRSEWSPVAGIRVYSEIIPTKTGHRRVHIVESEYECEAYDAGFAVPVDEADGCRVHILDGEGETKTIKPDPNTNLICTKTLIPMAVYHIKKGKNVLG